MLRERVESVGQRRQTYAVGCRLHGREHRVSVRMLMPWRWVRCVRHAVTQRVKVRQDEPICRNESVIFDVWHGSSLQKDAIKGHCIAMGKSLRAMFGN